MNIKEIARKAGVSVATVSRVLNHPENVAPKTKEHILKVMEESEYIPNWFARGLNFNKTNTIGLLIPNILNPGYMEIAKGVEDVAHQKDYTTLLCNGENELDKERKYIDTLIKRRIDGIVLISSLLEHEDIMNIKKQEIPIVLIGENKYMSADVPLVRIDCQNGAYKAVKHLIENKYKDIAIIYGDTPEQENKRKLIGYKQALEEEKIIENPEYIIEVGNNIEEGYIAAKKLIDLKKPPRAIFASSDLLAIGAIDAMKDYEVKVPEQIAVIGFDNIQMANLIEPKLTTIAKPMHKMGVVGARLLFDIMDSKDNGDQIKPREILLQSKLKIRKSCGHKERIGEIF
ncbi:LacI family DNA-binding transcriptional regulator [Anaerovorax odorimutans]|uniref:LacI family DNA-binding transcriptional regulator n=1 Tax=Anaerovorax odorimutans TaxID=109327 RepID=UPI0003F7286B|nr:LacI family DNA-binding transcriptional regulator [Anaerovorax odorimutans]